MTWKEIFEQFVLIPRRADFGEIKKEDRQRARYNRVRLQSVVKNTDIRRFTIHYKDGHKELAYLQNRGTLLFRGICPFLFKRLLDDWNVVKLEEQP